MVLVGAAIPVAVVLLAVGAVRAEYLAFAVLAGMPAGGDLPAFAAQTRYLSHDAATPAFVLLAYREGPDVRSQLGTQGASSGILRQGSWPRECRARHRRPARAGPLRRGGGERQPTRP